MVLVIDIRIDEILFHIPMFGSEIGSKCIQYQFIKNNLEIIAFYLFLVIDIHIYFHSTIRF
jgi:hypothetical protein